MMRIAPTRVEDIAALQAVERAASELFRESGLIPFPPEGAPVADVATHVACIEAGLSFTAFVDDTPVGMLLGIWHPESAYLAELSVDPRFGQRGIGRTLVAHYCALAAARGASNVTLSTFREPPWNAPFYRKLGFEELARADYAPWMHQYEANQVRGGLDVTKRLFMRRTL